MTALTVDESPRASTQAWATGAAGEEAVAAMLNGIAGTISLHDRRLPGSRANIDHLAITGAGVWVIDAKRYVGKRPEKRVEGGFIGFGGDERLRVGGRRSDRLVEGVVAQMKAVSAALDPSVPVRGALCFVEADWPLFGGGFTVQGVHVGSPRMLARRLLREATSPHLIDAGDAAVVLDRTFRPA